MLFIAYNIFKFLYNLNKLPRSIKLIFRQSFTYKKFLDNISKVLNYRLIDSIIFCPIRLIKLKIKKKLRKLRKSFWWSQLLTFRQSLAYIQIIDNIFLVACFLMLIKIIVFSLNWNLSICNNLTIYMILSLNCYSYDLYEKFKAKWLIPILEKNLGSEFYQHDRYIYIRTSWNRNRKLNV